MPLSKQALLVENNTNFPNNNFGYITPELLRQFNTDMIDAMQLTQSMSEYAELAGGNNFTGNQTITGNLNVSGVISASVLYVQTETASVIYSSGSNQFGDELIDVQTLSGSVKVQGSLTVNGVPVLTGSVSVDTGSLVTTASFNAYTQSTDLRLNSLETNSASVNVSISNLNTTTASLSTSITNINQFTQSQVALNGTFATTGSNTFTGNQIIDRASKLYTNGIYWTDPTAGFNNLEIINQGGGNLDFASLNGGKVRIVNTPLVLTGSALTSSNDISTSANVYGANLTASAIPAGTISSSAQISSLGFVSSSVTASSLITASFSGNTLTFTKGDASTFGVVIPDVSGSTINTGSFATTGSNNFVGDQIITGSLYVSSSTQKDVIIEGQLWVSSSNMFASGSTVQPQINISGPLSGTAGGSRSGSMQLIPDKITILRGTRTVNISSTVINVSDNGVGAAGQSSAIYPGGLDNGTLDGNEIGLTINGDYLGVTNFSGPSIWIADNTLAYKAMFGFQNTTNYTDGRITAFTPLSASAGFTASLQNGYAWVGNSLGQNAQVATSSFGSTINTGSFATTGSNTFVGEQRIYNNQALRFANNGTFSGDSGSRLSADSNTGMQFRNFSNNAMYFEQFGTSSLDFYNYNGTIGITGSATTIQGVNFIPFSASLDARILAITGSGGIINTGSFATTGSNSFNGSQIITGSITTTQDITVSSVKFGFGNPAGTSSIAIGFNSLANNTGANNIAIGVSAGQLNTTGESNTIIGQNAGVFLTSGSSNTIIGQAAGAEVRGGSGNTFIGHTSGYNTSGSNNTFIGPYQGKGNENGVIALSDGGQNLRAIYNSGWAFTGSVDIQNTLTASLAQGFTYVGDANGRTTLVATSSFGTSINTGSFAITGSNTFIGTQIISGAMFVYDSGSGARAEIMNGQISRFPQLYAQTLFPGTIQDDNGTNLLIKTNAGGATNGGFLVVNTVSGSQFTGSVAVQGNIDITGQYLVNGLPISGGNLSIFATTGSNTFTGQQTILADNAITISGSGFGYGITLQGQQGINLEGSGGPRIQFPNKMWMQGGENEDFQFTGDTDNPLTRGLDFFIYGSGSRAIKFTNNSGPSATMQFALNSGSMTFNAGNSITITGSTLQMQGFTYPTTDGTNGQVLTTNGSKVLSFTTVSGGTTYINPTLNPYSGSLILVANTFTSSSFAHISASANGQVNLAFKNNNNTADTIISGSNNIFTNPTAPTTGFKRYIGGSGNIILLASSIPQISGSMTFSPTMNNNYIGGNTSAITIRGPVSTIGTYNINGNSILGNVSIGSSATNHAEKLQALTMTGNQIAGNLSIIANKELLANTLIFNNNNLNGTATITAASGAISMANCNINDSGFTITNNSFTGVPGTGSLAMNRLNVGGQINSIIAENAGTASSYSDNIIFGTSNIVKIDLSRTNNAFNSNSILGRGLIVTGSSVFPEPAGALFTGRYNAQDGTRALTGENIFVVGTGTSTARKTGFLIDSGSNTFIEGTLNVSGSTTMTGSLSVIGNSSFNGTQRITGSLIVSASISLNGLSVTRGSGSNNTGLGVNVLQNAVSGGNVAIGTNALQLNTSGTDNIALGDNALQQNISGDRNMAIGSYTLDSNTTGTLNVAIGNATLAGLVDGNANVGIGFEALKNQTTSDNNVGIGRQALNQNISGSSNIAIGAYAGYNETGSGNFYIGNGNYGSLNADRSGSLMWGKMDTTTANQTLQINARTRFTNEVLFTTGSNQQAGTAVLDGANPGTVTVSNSLVTANSIIMVSKQTLNHPNGYVAVSAKSAGSFTITSNHNGDTDTVGWFIINNS